MMTRSVRHNLADDTLQVFDVTELHFVQWECHRKEWQTYQDLSFGRTAEGQEAGIPAVYECK